MRILTDVMKSNNYAAEPMLQSCGVKISSRFTQVEGRVLSAPKLKVGNGDDVIPRNRRWNFNSKRYFEPVKIEDWAVVNFSARCDIRSLCRDLARFGEMKRIFIRPPVEVFEESPQFRRAPAPVRVDKMFEQIQARFPKDPPRFLLCLLPDRENCDIYGPWKRKNLAEFGIFNQCLAPFRVNEYLMNVLLKINAKLGGLNSLLAIEQSRNLPVVSKWMFYMPLLVNLAFHLLLWIYSICLLEKRRMKLENGTSNSIDGENGLERVHESGFDMFGFSNPESDKVTYWYEIGEACDQQMAEGETEVVGA
ncbi:hypothetical protein K2173_013358 [Erythroxylum novogranatense]|uniref:Uncharacterized protein n=1 Tax=Erythroxylum novogranatense TaxID=1862640 RepID=A0AAV8S4C8_9ROSI|nr:hypothetical protein K2173_013358 [Erythroxylum novogranatense]